MGKLAKAYVLGEPFQSKRAAVRMASAINRHTALLRDLISEATPTVWAHGADIDGAVAWEKKALAALASGERDNG